MLEDISASDKTTVAVCFPDRGTVPAPKADVIFLRERSLAMLKNDLMVRNPLRLLQGDRDEILAPGQFGAVLARPGVGKTALMVQLALDTLLRGKNVLHISLKEPIGKVTLWYKQVFKLLASEYNEPRADQLWETILPHRFIMTFKVEGFSVPKLSERLTDLTAQSIFAPDVMLIDGLPFDAQMGPTLEELKNLASSLQVSVWFTITTHREDKPDPGGLPPQFARIQDSFAVALALTPSKDTIEVDILKGDCKGKPALVLDPRTLLIATGRPRA